MIITKTRKDLVTVREAWEPVKCTDGPVTWTKRLIWEGSGVKENYFDCPPSDFPKYATT